MNKTILAKDVLRVLDFILEQSYKPEHKQKSIDEKVDLIRAYVKQQESARVPDTITVKREDVPDEIFVAANFIKGGHATIEELHESDIKYIRADLAPQWMPIETFNEHSDDQFLIANFNNKPSFVSYGWKPYNYEGKWLKYTGGQLIGLHNLTHWMPLPQPPKEGE